MKQYKVGDTIYIKTTVTEVDPDDPALTYRGFDNEWIDTDTIVDELPTTEPAKPKLPKGVADEITEWRNSPHYVAEDTYFDQLIYEMISNSVESCLVKTRNSFIDGDTGIKTLLDAWNNGYTIEQAPRYKVYVTGTNKQFMYLKRGGWAKVDNKKATPITPQSINNYLTAGGNRDLYWFTDEEMTKFNLQDCEKELVADDSED